MFKKRLLLAWLTVMMAPVALASEWQSLKEGSTRIESEQSQRTGAKGNELPLPEGYYEVGQGSIDGAFGLAFGAPIKSKQIIRRLGWKTPASLPEGLAYRGLVKPLTVEQVAVSPPLVPALLKNQKVTYTAYVDFDLRPISISTSAFGNAQAILEIISRKYGEPDEVDGKRSTYIRGNRRLHIYSKHRSSAQLVYEDVEGYRAYLGERNLSLKRKFRNRDLDRLSPQEMEIVDLAKQLETYRQGDGEAFGLVFGRRVGFRAEPDEFVPFDAPKPLSSFSGGNYKIMVSPDLMPVAIRYELVSDPETLSETKNTIELAMELAFAGFLKQTPRHTVLSLNQHAYSLLIRNGQFNFTVHDRAENAARKARAKEAIKDQKRQEIAERQKEIVEEKAF